MHDQRLTCISIRRWTIYQSLHGTRVGCMLR